MRLFVAFDVPEAVSTHLKKIQAQLPDARMTLPSHFHQTLKFLGDISEDTLTQIKTRLSTISFQPFTVTLDKLGLFPNKNHIRVIWVGLAPTEPIIALQQQVDYALKPFPSEESFHPHVTIARVKSISNNQQLLEGLSQITPEPLSFTVDRIVLYESVLTPEGPEYCELFSVQSS